MEYVYYDKRVVNILPHNAVGVYIWSVEQGCKAKPISFFLIFKYFLLIYWLRWVFVAVHRLSLVAVSGGQLLLFVVVCRLLIVVASLVVEYRLWAHRLQ